MNASSFKDNRDSLILNISDMALRFDLHQSYSDLLYTQRFAHHRVIRSHPLVPVLPYDLESLLHGAAHLLGEFKVLPHQIINVYRHDRNDRFVLLECHKDQKLELDKELNGIKDRSYQNYGNMYRRKPDNYYRESVIREYLRIHKEQQRVFDMCLLVLRKLKGEEY